MKAINYYIVVDKIKEPPKKIGGLEFTEDQNKDIRYLKGKVISTGTYFDKETNRTVTLWKKAN